MAINLSGQYITYSDLITHVVSVIKDMCINVDANPYDNADLPDDLNPSKRWTMGDGHISISYQNKSNIFTSVPSTTVRDQLISFLQARGIYSKPSGLISSKTMLNFFSNVSIFISARLAVFPSLKEDKSFTLYNNSSSITYDNPSSITSMSNGFSAGQNVFSVNELSSSVINLVDQINKTSNIADYEFNIRYTCSSSSSSCSSSSCSSSCCSSSSSSFIVYMLI